MPVTLSVGTEQTLTIAADCNDFRAAQIASATQVFNWRTPARQ
jgi:aminopeptidase-like protein